MLYNKLMSRKGRGKESCHFFPDMSHVPGHRNPRDGVIVRGEAGNRYLERMLAVEARILGLELVSSSRAVLGENGASKADTHPSENV